MLKTLTLTVPEVDDVPLARVQKKKGLTEPYSPTETTRSQHMFTQASV